jgi:hypothetical protein
MENMSPEYGDGFAPPHQFSQVLPFFRRQSFFGISVYQFLHPAIDRRWNLKCRHSFHQLYRDLDE